MDSLLNKISRSSIYITDRWINGAIGAIVDIERDFTFRFVDYIIDGEVIHQIYISNEEKINCPILACGIIGYWIHHCNSHEGTNKIFEDYYNLKRLQYETTHKNDPNAWNRNLSNEFAKKHIDEERINISQSEAIFNYLTSSDVKKIQKIAHNYLKFAQSKRRNSLDMDDNLKLEYEFLALYKPGGIAHRCMLWIRDEYNLPYLPTFQEMSNNRTLETTRLSEKEISRHREKTKLIIEGYNSFDASILYYNSDGIMDEIEINIKNCLTEDELQRYVMSLITPFRDFADAFYSKSKIDNLKSILVKLEQELTSLNRINDVNEDFQNRISVIKKDILLINKEIEQYRHNQKSFYEIAQKGCFDESYKTNQPSMEYCLGQFWKWMITYGKRLASLLLLYKVNLLDVQEQCGIYLVERIRPQDYIDHKRICSNEQAEFLLKQLCHNKTFAENTEVSTYNEIVEIVYSIYQGLEKYPSNYKGKKEEALRDFILPSLQTLLTNITATGETFNCQGKTDICIKRTDGSNVFIGECKIWEGPKALLDAIDQLFNRYVTWKDTGVALIFFVKNNDFTQILDTAYYTVKQHPLYLREILPPKKREALYSFKFRHVQDPIREINMTLMLFHYNI